MRYAVLTFRTFHNRITKDLGVLVAAALVAVLGLPSAAQAQMKGITYADAAGFTADWSGHRLDVPTAGSWIVTFITPRSENIVLNKYSDGKEVLGTADTTNINFMERSHNAGLWSVWVDACFAELTDSSKSPEEPAESTADPEDVYCKTSSKENVFGATYYHGAPPAPVNLEASMIPGGVTLTWTATDADYGIKGYDYSLDGEKWTATKVEKPATVSSFVIAKVEPGEQTFWLRAVGSSDNDRNTQGSDPIVGEANSVTYMVPMPTPTLTESAALLLGLMLMGGGMYYTRRRQSGGLTPA